MYHTFYMLYKRILENTFTMEVCYTGNFNAALLPRIVNRLK